MFAAIRGVRRRYSVPVVCTGDIFDDGWRVGKCPPSLINFLLIHLPACYAVAGNHDLPNHRIEDVDQSAFETLVRAAKIHHLGPGFNGIKHGVCTLYGASWGEEIPEVRDRDRGGFNVLIAHRYVWTAGCSYPGAPDDGRADGIIKDLVRKGYRAAAFGDNHKPFVINRSKFALLNGGCLTIRRRDEMGSRPALGVLHADGKWRRAYLDVSRDRYTEDYTATDEATGARFDKFVEALKDLGNDQVDFIAVVNQMLRSEDQQVREFVLSCAGVT